MARILGLAMLCFLATAASAGESSVYARFEEDGSLLLSNVPAEAGYRLWVGEPGRPVAAQGTEVVGRIGGRRTGFDDIIESAASRYGVDSALLHAVITVESAYDPSARSTKGALGLMQLMPATARRYGVVDRRDPAQNVDAGARYLRDLAGLFDSDLSLMLAAYNAGEQAVLRNGRRLPPMRETLAYVPKVLAAYHRYRGEFRDAAASRWLR